MTTPQPVRLVLQAATLASDGEYLHVGYGNPVRIMDFARGVIQASGLVVNRDIEINVVGSRPGEKLHEQLWDEEATVTATQFPEVFRVYASADRLVPGLTGWAQINGRDSLSIPGQVALDCEYLERQSLAFDLKILTLTLYRTIKCGGISH